MRRLAALILGLLAAVAADATERQNVLFVAIDGWNMLIRGLILSYVVN